MLFDLERKTETVFLLFRKDNLVLTVKRGWWRGLPGGIISQNESCIDFALRVMPEFASLEVFGVWSRKITEDGKWENLPTRIGVVEFPDACIKSLYEVKGTEWTNIREDNPEFDVTIEVTRKIPRVW